MQTSRLLRHWGFFTILMLTMNFIPPAGGQISSWTDENGIRHYSNVEASEDGKTVKRMKEYETDASDEEVERNRDRFQILRMYEEDREKEIRRKATERKMREAEEKEKKEREAAEKKARERKRACAESMKQLDDLRHSKWEDYDDPDLTLVACPDRRWKGARGIVYDNMRECTERRDRARKKAYEEAIRRQEKEVETFCSQ